MTGKVKRNRMSQQSQYLKIMAHHWVPGSPYKENERIVKTVSGPWHERVSCARRWKSILRKDAEDIGVALGHKYRWAYQNGGRVGKEINACVWKKWEGGPTFGQKWDDRIEGLDRANWCLVPNGTVQVLPGPGSWVLTNILSLGHYLESWPTSIWHIQTSNSTWSVLTNAEACVIFINSLSFSFSPINSQVFFQSQEEKVNLC